MGEVNKIGVVGAGQMGNGIAHVCALSGYDVILNDMSPDALDKARETIEHNMTRQVSRDLIKLDDMKSAMSRISYSAELSSFEAVDLAVEAATEKEDVKKKIFEALCGVVPKHAYLASNTSSISITRGAHRPHLMN